MKVKPFIIHQISYLFYKKKRLFQLDEPDVHRLFITVVNFDLAYSNAAHKNNPHNTKLCRFLIICDPFSNMNLKTKT